MSGFSRTYGRYLASAATMHTDYPRHLAGFSYVGFQRYFLTFCTFSRQSIFVDSGAVDLVNEQFLRGADEQAMQITAYCFMPDHVHMVTEATSETTDLKQFIRRAKQFSGYHFARASGQRLWQRYGYERVLRDDEATKSVVKYALENPVRAGLVESVREYPFLGSPIYSREELIAFAYQSG